MFRIKTLNNISSEGLDRLEKGIFEVDDDTVEPDGILLRSYDMHGIELPTSLKAVARAGAGVNNIPVDACSKKGIVVFNTPGANANSVKELVLAAMLISSRKVIDGVIWAKSLATGVAAPAAAPAADNIPAAVEKGKKQFIGPEITGKTLGVIGLGAVGVLVANDAVSIGMKVIGHDPFISIESAWGLSREVRRASEVEELLSESDYISLHLPLSEKTRNFINIDKFRHLKKGARILNFARGQLVDTKDLLKALDAGIVERYVTDFPDADMVNHEKIIPIPHLGASTPEAEENCAAMAVDQLARYLKTGNISNSVNFPACDMAQNTDMRIVIANENIPNMVGQITTILAEEKINIADMLNRHLGDYAYTIIDIEGDMNEDTITRLKGIKGVLMARKIESA
ncbi:MAG: phosphoglycerate dehydrogenase [Spirochaetales bacterium]|jgi:D-3-phosphoglycerate dehydrogenase / 2-oxoglutarate reductase|nr:phosphoglycerate dehydrogenase [Spirochaetales bacterium]